MCKTKILLKEQPTRSLLRVDLPETKLEEKRRQKTEFAKQQTPKRNSSIA